MPEAPRRRPEKHEILCTFRAHVLARPAAVFEALDARLRPDSSSESFYTADASAFLIITQGGRWYRGEYRVIPDDTGSNVEHTVVNVAQQARSARGINARRVLASAPAEFELLIERLRREVE